MVVKRKLIIEVPAPEDHYNWGWIIWFAISLGGFAVLERQALAAGRHDRTLSVHLRRILGIYPTRRWSHLGKAIAVVGTAGFCSWFAHHIAFSPGDDPKLRMELIDAQKAGLG